MSFQAMTWSLGRASSLATQAILFSLAHHADHWGVTYIGQETIAEECSCRKATVTTNLQKLEAEGLIRRVQRRDSKGRRTSDHIVLAPNWEDRSGMADADKLAREKHPAEVCELARQQGALGVPSDGAQSTPDGSQSTPDEIPGHARRTRTDRGTDRGTDTGGEQGRLDVDPAKVQRLIDWHKSKVTARVGRPPSMTKAGREAAQQLVAVVEGDGSALTAMWDFAQSSGYWADKVLTLTDWWRHYPKLRAQQLGTEEQARSRPQRRDEPLDVPKARRVRYE